MGTLLTTWAPDGGDPILVGDEASVSLVRESVREHAARIGLDRDRAESLVAAASEIAHNQIAHAGGGEMLVRPIRRQDTAGLEVLAGDRGGGIHVPTTALRGESSTDRARSGGLGIGLGAAHRLADELDIDVRWGEGTTIAARKFASPLGRSEVAILGRPCQGETLLGDDALFVRRDGGLLLAVADGLGHGPLARDAAVQAMATVRQSTSVSPRELLGLSQAALTQTRGVVMSVVYVSEPATELVHAGVGNIGCHLYRDRKATRFPSTAGVLGSPAARAPVRDQTAPLGGRHVIVLFSDGLSSRLDLAGEAALLREHPLVIAQHLFDRHGRTHDDALVMVATG
jgi:anti-sigma regulatory factor (Ser/Thr protein kinase)